MYKLLFLSGLISVLSLGDVCAMDREEGRRVLTCYQKGVITDFLDPNNFVDDKEKLGFVTPFDLDFCDEMTQCIDNNDIEATKWAIAEKFLFDVSSMQKSVEFSEICNCFERKKKCKYSAIVNGLNIYKSLFGQEYTTEIFNYYMQDKEIKRHYNIK